MGAKFTQGLTLLDRRRMGETGGLTSRFFVEVHTSILVDESFENGVIIGFVAMDGAMDRCVPAKSCNLWCCQN
jgi:hypothetical protein